MHVSLQSKLCLGTSVAIGIYNAYLNPVRWITFFAVGILMGTCAARLELNGIQDKWAKDDQMSGRQITSLLTENSFYYLALATASNLIALVVISKEIKLPLQIPPRFFSILASIATGFFVGFNGTLLETLRRNKNPDVQKLLAETTI